MLSKGDLVKIRLPIGGASQAGGDGAVLIFGKMMNYCDGEDSYIVEPRAISIQKGSVEKIDRLLADFDFEDVTAELSVGEQLSEREIPPDIVDIRVSKDA